MNAVEDCLLHGLKVAGSDHPALIGSDETLSYGALAARVAKFAAGLRETGVTSGDRVALLMLDTPDFIALHLAAMAMGAVASGVSTRASERELGYILAIIRPAVLAIDAEFEPIVSRVVPAAAPGTRVIHRDRELAGWKQRPETELKLVPREPTDAAFWVMTSGTTGMPKAVEHRHDIVPIADRHYSEELGAGPADRLFGTSRLHFAYAVGIMLAALRLGATNILLDRWATAPTVAATIERFKPTIVLSVPAIYHLLLNAGLPQTPPFRAVRHYLSAGERLPPKIWTAWEEKSGLPILDGFGCSELVFFVTGNTPGRRRPGSSGHPSPGVEARIVGDDGQPLGPDQEGRLEIRMLSVCSGYRDALSAPGDPPQRPDERFRPGGWFATGDQYMQDAEGFLFHRGRTGDLLRVSGIWVSPSEIEDALGGIASIAESAAVLGESEIGLAEIALYVVPAPGADGAAAVAAARERLSTALPGFKQPRRFEAIAALPRTATGKVQRHKLREQLCRDH
jgi:3-hydroxybenzoate/4-hydroxybenzoate---CoA ligase